ncbi:MAG TPA: ATP-binding protein [Candidatus Xenobia bacterium]
MSRAEDLFNLLCSGGAAAIDQMIADRVAESLFLDFKQSPQGGTGKSLGIKEQDTLAKAISGFGNAGGGILIWGVECDDVAEAKKPIPEYKRFVSLLENAVSRSTTPAHPTVLNKAIDCGSPTEGYAVTYIPESPVVPLRAIQGSQYYYMRAGSSFSHVPHGVLAAMFGRMPGTDVRLGVQLNNRGMQPSQSTCLLGLTLENLGSRPAADSYVTWKVSLPSRTSLFALVLDSDSNPGFVCHTGNVAQQSLTATPAYRIPPFCAPACGLAHVDLRGPFTEDLRYEVLFGCNHGPVHTVLREVDKDTLNQWFKDHPAPRAPDHYQFWHEVIFPGLEEINHGKGGWGPM